ncbi:MAG TPA: 23S rRNA (adenine(2030)-N(6))-methyltransferase RlmJ [Vineibacter sp.]|nr:23S rRNA (adenine(2030)-N(6))-methyltransferase RlmJ [Vineibacter sp.]
MNYRHGFHAGNFADVLKHVAWLELLRLMAAKDKKLFVLDTHAGRGGYDLTGEQAARSGEWQQGVGRLLAAEARPPVVRRYLEAVRAYDRKFGVGRTTLGHYPGSPRLTRPALRAGDRCVICEAHQGEATLLRREFAGDKAVEVRFADGYAALKALLPPPERRGLVLLDPPFEKVDEFPRAARALVQALKRFATGVYALWYPLKDEAAVLVLRAAVAGFAPRAVDLELKLAQPLPEDGLHACGLIVINPPWTFDDTMKGALPWLAHALGRGPGAHGAVRWLAGAA